MASTYTGFDKILEDYVGGHGFYQLKTTLIMALPHQLTSLIIYLIIFSADEPKHRCQISLCENEEMTEENIFGLDWLDFAIPKSNGTSNFLAEKPDFDSCKMYTTFESVHNFLEMYTIFGYVLTRFLGNVQNFLIFFLFWLQNITSKASEASLAPQASHQPPKAQLTQLANSPNLFSRSQH